MPKSRALASYLDELNLLPHAERVVRLIALGRAASNDRKAAALCDELWQGDVYQRRLALKSCYGSRDGARVLTAVSDPSRLLRGTARKLVALFCEDEQATEALKATYMVRQHLRVLQALRQRNRTAPIDGFLDWLQRQPGDTRLGDYVPFASAAGIERHLPAALARPSRLFWERMLRYAPQRLAELFIKQLDEKSTSGSVQPDTLLLWAVQRSLLQLAAIVPDATVRVCEALLKRGVKIEPGVLALLIRHRPQRACDLGIAQRIQFAPGAFQEVIGKLGPERVAALVAYDRSALGDLTKWLRKRPEILRPALLRAWLDGLLRQPTWGLPLLDRLSGDLASERDPAYVSWSHAARDKDGVIQWQILHPLPIDLRVREARRHLEEVTALKTRPSERIRYACYLSWEEAGPLLKLYIGHPEGETRGHALSVLLAIPGRSLDRPDLVAEALRMAKARRNEQDPVRLLILQALLGWPKKTWRREHLNDVGQLVRDALDAADLSHATAQAAEQLVVRLFFLDGAWGGKWLATLIKERGTIYAPRLGDRLSDDDVRAVAPALLEVATAWATREREAHLVQLAASLGDRISLVSGLSALLEKLLKQTATETVAHGLMSVFYKHSRTRFDELIAPTVRDWMKRKWDGVLLALATELKRGELPEILAEGLKEAVERCTFLSTANRILLVLRDKSPAFFRKLLPQALDRDQSLVCLSVVHDFLHRRRQDLLTPFLGGATGSPIITGRFATGKTRWLLPFSDGFFRWNPDQQERFQQSLEQLALDTARDTPTVFWALLRMPRLSFIEQAALIRLADDGRAAVQERAVRTLGRCDAGQGVAKLLLCLEDTRARYAIYALRSALLEMPPPTALELLRKVPMQKVTVAKEVVRLLGELRSDGAYSALLALDSPTLHRDIRVALLRALWDHLDRDRTWEALHRAAIGSDFILAARVGDIPADRLTVDVDRRLAFLLGEVLRRPEPEARLELLTRAASLPMRDRERSFFGACLARLDSRFADEVKAAMTAILARGQDGDAPIIRQAFRALLPNRFALFHAAESLLAALPPRSQNVRRTAESFVEALAEDELAVPLYLRCAGKVYAKDALRLTEICVALAKQNRLQAEALRAAKEALLGIQPADLPPIFSLLNEQPQPELRLLALHILTLAAGPGHGWTDERRAQLAVLLRDPSTLVRGAAQFIFPPLVEPAAEKS